VWVAKVLDLAWSTGTLLFQMPAKLRGIIERTSIGSLKRKLRGRSIDLMSTVIQYPHLTLDDDGTARIERMRYRVIHLAGEHDHYGWSAEEILRQHPDLRPEQVHAALTYFDDHYDRRVEEMRVTLRGTAESVASTQPRLCARRSDRPKPRGAATTDLANRHRQRQKPSLNVVERIPIRLDDDPARPGPPRRRD
jgi:uncharacterized protein (DUF433 family)